MRYIDELHGCVLRPQYGRSQANEIHQIKVTIMNVKNIIQYQNTKEITTFQCKFASILINNTKNSVQILILILSILMA